MSDTHAPQGDTDRRRRPNRRRQGGQSNRNNRGPFRPKPPKQTTLQKILSFLTFGLLGKPQKRSSSGERREPTSNVTVVTSRRPEGGGRDRDRDGSPDRDRGDRDRQRRTPSAPDLASVISDRLYVGNLSYDASESDLFELFNGVGDVRNAEVVVNNRTQRSKGFAFVTMGSTEEARRAVAELHGKDFMGRSLQISGAKPASNRDDDRDESPDNEDEAEETARA
jgi:hypothetical protein